MSDICKFVKMKKLALSLFIDLYVGKSMINCLSLCVSGGLSVCLFRISISLPVFFYHTSLHLSTVGLLSVSRLTDQSVLCAVV